MNMNAMKNNTGKLLAAVLVMAMVIAGAAIVFSDDVQATPAAVEGQDGVYTIDDGADLNTILTDSTTYSDVTKIVANKDITLTANADISGITLDMGTYTIDTGSYSISGSEENHGKITAVGKSTQTNHQIVNLRSTISHVDFEMTKSTEGYLPWAAIVTFDQTTSINNCTFTLVGGGSFGAVQAWGTSTTIVNSTMNGGIITYTGTGHALALNNLGEVNVNVLSGKSSDITLLGNTKIADFILGWDEAQSANPNGTDSNVDFEVDSPLAAETVRPGDAEKEGSNNSITVVEGGKFQPATEPQVPVDVEGGDVTMSGNLAIGDTINADLVIEDYAYLTDHLVIPEGKTLTILGTATLNMYSFNITVNGTLVIERNGVITSSGDTNSITLTRTGAIQNSGIIGDDNTVTITGQNPAGTSVGKVEMQGVSGVNVNLVRTGSTYYLAVSGDISKISSVSTANLGLSDVTINANTQIGRNVNVTITDAVEVAANVALTNGGVMNITDVEGLVLNNGSSLVVNGSTAGVVCVKTGTVGQGSTVSGATKIILGNNVRGITISADRVTIPSDIPGGQATIEQRAYIAGSANYVTNDNSDGRTIQIEAGKEIYVIDTLFIPEEVTVSGGVFDVSAAGTVQVEMPSAIGTVINYIGAKYTVESTSEGVTSEMDYYTSFANAMGAIANAKDTTITISGEFTIDQSYQLDADHYIAGDAEVTIGEDAVITLNDGATIDNTAFSLIEGQVVVNDGGTYRPASDAGIYAVTSTNKETNTTIYSGFKIALNGAAAGDVISVVGDATYDGNMTIISGVTVNLNDNVDLKVTGSVTVQTDGELNLGNASVLTVGTASKTNSINVAGSIDSSEGTIAGLGTVNLYSTGEVVYPASTEMNGVKVNAAYYDDGDRVYTSVANAAAYAEENILTAIYATGTFSESGEVTLTVPLYIQNGADVTLGTVTLDGTSVQSTTSSGGADQGVYSATVNGMSGTGAEAVVTTVVVDDTTATITSGSTLSAAGENQYTMSISAINGDVEIAAGTVELSATGFTISADDTLAVASGATLVLGTDNSTIAIATGAPAGVDYNDNLVNDGTILIQSSVSLGSNITLPGDVTVNEGGQLTIGTDNSTPYTLTVTGTLTISDVEDEEGSMAINGGILVVGAAPKMLGQTSTGAVVGDVAMTGNAYVKVFQGASVADAVFTDNSNNTVKSTAFVINGTAFATVYTFGTQNAGVVNTDVGNLINLDQNERDSTKIVWFAGETFVGNTPAIGTYAELSTEIKYAGVEFTVSEGPGVSIYIDNVDVDALRTGTSGTVFISIGQHTITVYVNSGYEGTPSITMNGTAISGTFEVTSDMIGGDNVIFATGASPIDYNQGGSSDGMGLTEILLIILVVLIVVMAIMVALRLMRS